MSKSDNMVGCANFNCPISGNCYRFMVHPTGEEHIYQVFTVYEEDGVIKCKNFIHNETDREIHSSTKH